VSRNVLSNSQRACSSCSRRWLFRYGLGLEGPRPESPAMSLGKMVHALLAGEPCPEPEWPDQQVVWQNAHRLVARYRDWWQAHPSPNNLTIIQNEVPIGAYAGPGPGGTGHGSLSPRWFGVVDALAKDSSGAFWIVERKTSSMDLVRWVEQHGMDPQPLTYAWLVWRATGHMPVGMVFDLLNTSRFRPAKDLTNKDGTLSKIRAGTLPGTDADHWAAAMNTSGCSEEWAQEVLRSLKARDAAGHWFHRYPLRFDEDHIVRTGEELYHIGIRLQREHRAVSDSREDIAATEHAHALPAAISLALHEHAAKHPRNWSECWAWNRPCEYMQACWGWSPDDCSTLQLRQRR
jgi:hypothetical protein